jgi:prolyl-tRNA editing enzyme YbaK/EbsC (Cys-tRNA(Pro) deacylase)
MIGEDSSPHGDYGGLLAVDAAAVEGFLAALRAAGVPHTVRTHEPARHARHLAALWRVPLPHAGRATLFAADGSPVLALVPANRKVSAPRLAAVVGAAELRVLRGDRGVGRLGWRGLPEPVGALSGVPGLYGARVYVEELVLTGPELIIALDPGRSVRLHPEAYVLVTEGTVAPFAGTTRLLPEGGMIDEAVGATSDGHAARG